jgi:hypothetical protein
MIGNILIDNKLKVDDNFNVVDSFDELIEGIPTLIIGLDNANKLNKKLNYVDRKIDNNTFWTFSKSEKRMLFEDDIFYFIENSYKSLINSVEYIFIDYMLSSKEKINKVNEKIIKNKNNHSFLIKDMMYVYCDKHIFGFDLRQISYIDKDKNTFISKIKSNSIVFLEGEEILIEYNHNLGMMGDEVKYIPLLYSIKKQCIKKYY